MSLFGVNFPFFNTNPVDNIKQFQGDFGCTDFSIQTQDKKTICTRSMEFPIPMKSVITFHPRGEQRTSTAPGPNNPPGLSWTSQFGYVAISVFGTNDAVEGMNETRLSCGFLTLQCSQYQTVPSNCNSQALELLDVGSWILGNFTTVDEVANAIKNVYVWGRVFPPLGSIPGLHIALHDINGNHLVIEYLNGEPVITQNPIGVLTNDPPLSWHITNLGNYNCLSPNPAPNIVINGVAIPAPRTGSGMLGLPGGWSSVSRYIRIAKILQFVWPAKTASEAVNLAVHVINNVDKPKGVCLTSIEGPNLLPDITRWCVVKNLNDGNFYYYSYKDLVLRVIRLSQINFGNGKKYADIPVDNGSEFVIDMTPRET